VAPGAQGGGGLAGAPRRFGWYKAACRAGGPGSVCRVPGAVPVSPPAGPRGGPGRDARSAPWVTRPRWVGSLSVGRS